MNGAPVRVERRYRASPEQVWAALTEPVQLRGWLGEGIVEPWEGGRVRLRLPDPDGGVAEGEVREWRPPEVLALTWNWPGEPASLLRFALVPDGEDTRLLLEHRLPPALAEEYRRGWGSHLERLQAHLARQTLPPRPCG